MKISVDWQTGVLPAIRTAGALMIGNAGVTFLIGTANPTIAWTMGGIGASIVVMGSIKWSK